MSEKQTKFGNRKSDQISKEIEVWKSKGANLLLPSTTLEGLSDFHAPVIDSVTLSPDPKDGDVYPASNAEDNKYFRFTAQGLRKLSVCAGIIWHPYECKRVDSRQDKLYVHFQAVGGIRKADGQPVWWKGEYDLDFEIIEEELIDQYERKCANWNKSDAHKQAYVERNVKKDLIFKRKHKLKLAETGAMNRVVRAILGLKNQYTKEELANPFVMLRITIRPDFTDKEVRAKLIEAAVKSMVGIYGPEVPIDVPSKQMPEMENVIELDPDDDEDEPIRGSDEDEMPTDREIFDKLTIEDKRATCKQMAEKAGYDLTKVEFDVDKLSEHRLMEFRDYLSGMIESLKISTHRKKNHDDDDIPF